MISWEALLMNLDVYQSLHSEYSIFPVLKSNAYGHGIREIASILSKRKCSYIVVDSYHEALEVQKVNKTSCLLMGYTLPENFQYMDFSFVTPVVFDYESLYALGKTGNKIRVHLKIDTGMHRQGIHPEEVHKFLQIFKVYKNLLLEGICTHLMDSDNSDNSYTLKQVWLFKQTVDFIQSAGYNPRYIHISNSAGGTKEFFESSNAIRLGIGLYGINPLNSMDSSYEKLSKLHPVLRFESTLILKKKLRKWERVSYNGTFVAPEDMTIGIIPVGYYEGIPRSCWEGRFGYIWNNCYFPILGRVCMNMTIVNLGNASIEVGEKIIIISDNSNDLNSVYSMAHVTSTIPYECLTGISESIRRKLL